MCQSHFDIGKGLGQSRKESDYSIVLPVAIARSMLSRRVSGFCLVRNFSGACSRYSETALKVRQLWRLSR